MKFLVLGDTRGTSSSDQINMTVLPELAAQVVSQNPEFVIVSGDLVSSGTLAAFQKWKAVMAPVYSAGIGVYPVMGNHDANDPTDWATVFGADVPANGPTGEVGRTYAFTCGNVLILGLDTYKNLGRVNQTWVDSILAQKTVPHVFSFGHMPAFKVYHADCLDDYPTQRDAFWSSLRNAGSRAYFCGHDHFYDHIRIDDGDGNPNNDVHQLIVGGGGAPLYSGWAYNGANTIWTPVAVSHEMQYGYTVVEVNDLAVTMSYYHRTGANTWVATSETWSYTVDGAPTPPPAPTGLSATAGNAQVALTWSASSGATSYHVKRATGTPSGPYATVATGVATTSWTDTTAANGTTYYYVVTAVNSVGESGPSAYIGATPQAPPSVPNPPASLAATVRRGQVKLTWTASTGATSYVVKRSNTRGGPYAVLKTGVASTNYTDAKLKNGLTYYYVVSAVNSAGESANSPEVSATPK